MRNAQVVVLLNTFGVEVLDLVRGSEEDGQWLKRFMAHLNQTQRVTLLCLSATLCPSLLRRTAFESSSIAKVRKVSKLYPRVNMFIEARCAAE